MLVQRLLSYRIDRCVRKLGKTMLRKTFWISAIDGYVTIFPFSDIFCIEGFFLCVSMSLFQSHNKMAVSSVFFFFFPFFTPPIFGSFFFSNRLFLQDVVSWVLYWSHTHNTKHTHKTEEHFVFLRWFISHHILFYYHSVRFTLQCQLQCDQIRASVVRVRVKLCNCKCSHHVALFISTISIHFLFSATGMLSMCSHRSLSYFGKEHYGFKIYKFCIYT